MLLRRETPLSTRAGGALVFLRWRSDAPSHSKPSPGFGPVKVVTIDIFSLYILFSQCRENKINKLKRSIPRTIVPKIRPWYYVFSIWQAPRAGKMRRILCSDWLPDRAELAGKMDRYCPLGTARLVAAIKFRRSTKVFFCKIVSVAVKRFSAISLSGWN